MGVIAARVGTTLTVAEASGNLGVWGASDRLGWRNDGWALGPPARCPFTDSFWGRFGSPTKIDRKKGTLVLTSLLEDLALDAQNADYDHVGAVAVHLPFVFPCSIDSLSTWSFRALLN